MGFSELGGGDYLRRERNCTVDYYQGVVTEYLRADRAIFVNTECCLQLNAAANPDNSGPHWYCDAVAVNFRESAVYLCEISYSKTLDALVKRLTAWQAHWPALCRAIVRDCHIPATWSVRPWLFVPEERRALLEAKLQRIAAAGGNASMVAGAQVTNLEDVAPWKYRSWNRWDERSNGSVDDFSGS